MASIAEAVLAPPIAAPRFARPRGIVLAAGGVAALVLAPLATLALLASRGSGALWPHLARYVLPQAALETMLLLAGVGAIVAVVGTGTAWLVTAYHFPGRRVLGWALLLPLAMPTYIVAYAYLDVLHPLGPVQSGLRALLGLARPSDLSFPEIRSLGGCALLLGFVLYPYVYLNARAAFAMQSADVLDAARTLGANGPALFLRVAVPLAWPAVAVGLGLALMETLNDVGAAEFLGVQTLTRAVYVTWVTRGSVEGAAGIALVMLVLVGGLVALERLARRRTSHASAGSADASRRVLGRVKAPLAACACALPVLIGFAVPALHLVGAAWRRVAEAGLPPALGAWVGSSALFAAIATVAALGAGLLLAFAMRVAGRGDLLRLASLGYALPGTVIAVGLLSPLGALDNALDDAARVVAGIGIGLVLSGSGAALVLAYVIRYLAIPAGGLEAGYAKLPAALDDAGRTFGATDGQLLARIHLPLLSPALGAAALLTFIDCMKELPATLILRPLNVETLATAVFGEASRGTYEDGAVAALAIVLFGLLPVALLAVRRRGPRLVSPRAV